MDAKSEPAPVLKLRGVTKRYGLARGIDDIHLSIAPGEVFGFLGPNGAGKSTTINTILDLLRPNKGTIQIFGLDHRADSVAIRKKVGFLSGDMATDPGLTGRQYLAFAASLHGNVDPDHVNELVTKLRCETDKKIKTLSRGNRQKIGLVAALMHDPDLLILDEPTSGLDPLIQNEFNELIRERKKRGKTTFMSSHVLSEVQAVCDRVGFIREGKLIRVSKLEELMTAAPRRVHVVYTKTAPDTELQKLDGVSAYTKDGNRREFVFRGNYNELSHTLALKPMSDLQVLEPALEELFMEYYRDENNEGAHV